MIGQTQKLDAFKSHSEFTTMVSNQYGCSKGFKEIMGQYHIKNLSTQLKNENIDSRIKSRKNKITIEFKR